MSFSGKNVAIVVTGATLLFVTGCVEEPATPSDVPEGVVDLRVELDPPEFGYQIKSDGFVVPANSEKYICSVVRVDPVADEELIWLNNFESRTSNGSHHMNVHVGLFSVMDWLMSKGAAETVLGKELGTYDCDEFGDLMEEQSAYVVYPSQKVHQKASFPDGVAVPGIAPLVMVMNHHYINTSDENLYVNAAVNFGRVEESEVEHVLTGFAGGAPEIEIPGNSRKIEAWTCAIDRPVTMVAISTHSHERGDCFTLNDYDGKTSEVVDEPFFVNKDWESPPIQFYEDGVWEMREGDGVHWACHWDNPEDRKVVDGGSANDEMCIFVGVGYPNRLTVQDIKDMVADPGSVNASSIVPDAMIDCKRVIAESPWPSTFSVVDRSNGSACDPFEQTLE